MNSLGGISLDGLMQSGQAARDSGDWAGALEHYAQAAALFPHASGPRVAAGGACRILGKLSEARTFLAEAVRIDPQDQFGWHELGLLALAEGNWPDAIAYYQEGCWNRPELLYRQQLAQALIEHGDYQSARHVLDEVLRIEPDNLHAWLMMIRIAGFLCNHHLIVASCKAALDHHPTDTGIRTQMVDALRRLDLFDEALAELDVIKRAGDGDIYVAAREQDLRSCIANGRAPTQTRLPSLDQQVRAERLAMGWALDPARLMRFASRAPLLSSEGLKDFALTFAGAGRTTEALFFARKSHARAESHSGKSGDFYLNIFLRSGLLGGVDLGFLRGGVKDVRIPKLIHQFWDRDIPNDVMTSVATWKTANPDCVHTLYSEQSARDFIAERCSAPVLEAYDYAHHPAMKADIFRLAVIYHQGGFYIDADDSCCVPISEWFKNETVELIVSRSVGPETYLHNWFFAAEPRHPVVGHALELATANVLSAIADQRRAYIWEDTGPGCLSRAFLAWLSANWTDASMKDRLRAMVILPETAYRHVAMWHTNLNYRSQPGGDWKAAV